MSVWHELPMVGYDCETTGVNVEEDRIVTASIVVCGAGQHTITHNLLADPGIPIPDEAAKVHGITTEHAQEHGWKAPDAIAFILELLRCHLEPGRALVAMNARFDLTVLDREARRYGMVPLGPVHVVDPYVIDKWIDRFRRGPRKLDALCEHYGARLDDAHTADADAIAACRVAWQIAKHGQPVRTIRGQADVDELSAMKLAWSQVRDSLPDLHWAQVGWAAEQARGLQEYFARQGRSETVHPEWPLIPIKETV